ncbi:NAD(P)H-dependent oxidoreductase [Actinosynnema sp. NPDC047251]|uniref:FMN dependent NADH:quinone oxidoreductase n=1 Tax=Saccharothrix espanaensis (strain ATCC 51144 / DSM 44229 / JCM 9112 / NBRC 15066 / NRRL 15764) TaxID=1179773 RepID=K0JWQ7_SACES|nr:NAD(P)H-dependent oxidoreductase [Saccharothrix espanaensis]CCH28588.1 NAD(P)H dehydrogenase (quinone) [Saccharothrix espanaensis DSM 44229]
MTGLLHIDSSVRTEGSVSREVTAAFATAWREARPDVGYTYRDLAARPLPHVDGAAVEARQTTDRHRVEQELVAELTAADTVLIGAPMYNFSLPSGLKAWLDWILVPEHFANPETGVGALSDKHFVIVTARGGSYAPGTPRHTDDYQEPYLRFIFERLGVRQTLEFVHTELTLAHTVPHLAQFRDKADESREDAHRTVRKLALA